LSSVERADIVLLATSPSDALRLLITDRSLQRVHDLVQGSVFVYVCIARLCV
jgi:hypothetical protein